MDFSDIIHQMKEAGVCFSSGLTNDTMTKIEEIYEIRFPDSLRAFYQAAFPISVGGTVFPRWNDFSSKNITLIRQQMRAPYQWLKRDIERGFWLSVWGGKTVEELLANVPKLIPIYSHRYMPMLDHVNPPVISTVGRDTACYGVTLEDYLFREFCQGNDAFEKADVPYIPLWSDIIHQMEKEYIISAHKCCSRNKIALKKSNRCGCFYCLATFSPEEISDWIIEKNGSDADLSLDERSTARCPRCGTDSVIGDAFGFPITEAFLGEMKKYWFELH